METAANKLLEVMAAFGFGVLLVLGLGFYLFYKLRREADRRDAPPGNHDPEK